MSHDLLVQMAYRGSFKSVCFISNVRDETKIKTALWETTWHHTWYDRIQAMIGRYVRGFFGTKQFQKVVRIIAVIGSNRERNVVRMWAGRSVAWREKNDCEGDCVDRSTAWDPTSFRGFWPIRHGRRELWERGCVRSTLYRPQSARTKAKFERLAIE